MLKIAMDKKIFHPNVNNVIQLDVNKEKVLWKRWDSHERDEIAIAKIKRHMSDCIGEM